MEAEKIAIYIPDYEAKQFLVFQKHYLVVNPILEYMDSLNLSNLNSMSVTLDIDERGKVRHTSITKHYRS